MAGPTTNDTGNESGRLLFRGRAVTPLAFGTSGLRGLVTDITELEAWINTRGFLEYLLERGEAHRGQSVCLAGDLRPSTGSPERGILRAVAQAVRDAGFKVDYLGKLPTPALTYYAMETGVPSIMVTGSHIPFDRNGIKFNKPAGEVLKADEPGILRAISRVRQSEYNRPATESAFADDCTFKPGSVPPQLPANPQATHAYMRRYLDFFGAEALRGLRLVFYQHSAVGRDLMVELLTALGAQVFALGRTEEFVPIDTEALPEEKLRLLQQLADQARRDHGAIDAVVSTDGDSDRPLLAGVDHEGQVRFFNGDLLGLVVAEQLAADAVAVPISANDAVDLWAAEHKVKLLKTRIGSPHVIAGMEQLRSQGFRRVAGWEANGGFLTGSAFERNGPIFKALPTRDAALPLIAALARARTLGVSVVELFGRLPRRFGMAGLIDQFPVAASRALMRQLLPEEPNIEQVEFEAETVRIFVRGGGTRYAAASERSRLIEVRTTLERHFNAAEGFGPMTRFNFLDGVRVWFRNGDIAHIRPSGNAPQLRIYAVAASSQRAAEIVARSVAEPDGILRRLEAWAGTRTETGQFAEAIRRNIALTQELFARGDAPEVIGTVAGSNTAQAFWQEMLNRARESFRARAAVSLHEDLPTNQAFGLLLLWQRLKPHLEPGWGALVAFVFGEGTRSTPFTETDNGQKPAIATFVREGFGKNIRFVSMVELALRYFVPVRQYLWRSGFRGLVVKWGDEVQIPTLDLSGSNPLFRDADVVRFVSVREVDADGAKNKDWVGVDAEGRVTAFIPRRPLVEMEALADRGLLQRRGGRLYGGVNLGSIAVSAPLLDELLGEFQRDVNDPTARRGDRPALDPEFFTALTIALIRDPATRSNAWALARKESPEVEKLQRHYPDVLDRLERVIASFQQKHRRLPRMVAMDFGDQYWGDIGQHAKIYEFYLALNHPGPEGGVARALAGIANQRDENQNLLVDSRVAPGVQIRNSVLIGVELCGTGLVENSVLIGTRARDIHARDAFDVLSTVRNLTLAPRAGTYKVVSAEPVQAGPGERLTTLFLPRLGGCLFRVREETDLKKRSQTYAVPIEGNPRSFEQAHAEMSARSIEDLEKLRKAAQTQVNLE